MLLQMSQMKPSCYCHVCANSHSRVYAI